jgi:hypothetical protein
LLAGTVLLVGLAIPISALAASIVLPAWLPGLSDSILGAQPGLWYLSRLSGIVAFTLLWLSMLWGLLVTNRLARQWPGVVPAMDCTSTPACSGSGSPSSTG